MNRSFTWVSQPSQRHLAPTPEATSMCRVSMRYVAAAVVQCVVLPVWATPGAAQVSTGQAHVSQSGSTTTVTQTSTVATINWSSFDVGASETVNFMQPNAASMTLNRILGSDPSQIFGRINANGQVWLLNPNGILFGRTSQVNVGGLVASTLSLSDSEFQAGRYTLSGGTGAVTNQGQLRAGYVALVGARVSNEGDINTPGGMSALAAGAKVTLNFSDNTLYGLQIDEATLAAQVRNAGAIVADGGGVLLTAEAKDALLSTVVNNEGLIQARSIENRGGVIRLLGGQQGGTVQVGGQLDASALGAGDGGLIETSGSHVKVNAGARISTLAAQGKTGNWLIDPVDFTVAASGGDITGASLSSNLATNNVTLQSISGSNGTSGNLNVNDAVSWSANTTLTLNAQNNVNVNADITASGASGAVALQYGQGSASGTGSGYSFGNGAKINLQAGNNFSTKQGSSGPTQSYTVITSLGIAGSTTGTDLQGIAGNLGARYVLGADIDASSTAAWNSGAGFAPIGVTSGSFSGTFDGLGHTISGLTINRSGAEYVGLFGDSSGRIANVGLIGGSVQGASHTGALVAFQRGTVRNSYATTSVTGTGFSPVGGLVGTNQGTVVGSHANGSVQGLYMVGGLVGWNQGLVTSSYATGAVTNTSIGRTGGLVGSMLNSGSIDQSFATGAVTSPAGGAGGLVGYWDNNNTADSFISNSYATGSVTGGNGVGGLVGQKVTSGGTLTNSYALGAVSGTGSVGGLVGSWTGDAILGSFWNTTTTGQAGSSGGGIGMSTADMLQQGNFISATAANGGINPGWDFSSVWRMYEGATYPLLKAFMQPATVTANNVSKTYDKTAWSGSPGYTCSAATGVCNSSLLLGTPTVGGSAQGAINAGTYTNSPSGLYSTQLGYDLTFVDGTLTINPYSLTVGGVAAASKVYDATTAATLNGTASVSALAGDVVTVAGTGSASFADKNVGNGKAVTVTGYLLSGADAGNYVIVQPAGLSADITPASLAVSGVAATSKVYDASTGATLTGAASVSALAGDVVSVAGTGSASFVDKNVGNGKTVTVTGYLLSGADAGNYTIVQPTGLSADITPASLTVSGVAAASKVYDASTGATLTGAATVSALAGDVVTVAGTGSANFADKNVGNGKAVTVTGYLLSGADAGNYTIVQPTGLSADITPASLTVSGVATASKVYDATTAASLNGTATVSVLAGDTVTVAGTGSASFADKNVGNGKAVTVTGYLLSGADAGNYVIVQPTGLSADITPASLTVSGVAAASKVYDATTAAALNGVASVNALAGDTVTLAGTGSASFVDKNVGNGKEVTVTGYLLSGTDAGNYAIVQPTGLSADITPASLTVSGVVAASKVYDATTAAALNGVASANALAGDTVTVAGTGSASFADKNVGNGKAVTVTGYLLSGADAGNYTIVQPTGLSADITPAGLTVSGVAAANRVYDATTAASLNGTATVSALAGDAVTVAGTGSASFADKNVGNGKEVTVTGYLLSGADAGNYTIVQPTGLSANITPASLTLSTNDVMKPYDGTTVAHGSPLVVAGQLYGSDTVTGGIYAFTDRNAGVGKTVTVSAIDIVDGNGGANYSVAYVNNTRSSIISQSVDLPVPPPQPQQPVSPTQSADARDIQDEVQEANTLDVASGRSLGPPGRLLIDSCGTHMPAHKGTECPIEFIYLRASPALSSLTDVKALARKKLGIARDE